MDTKKTGQRRKISDESLGQFSLKEKKKKTSKQKRTLESHSAEKYLFALLLTFWALISCGTAIWWTM
jgi:hypothetical protein